MKKHYSKGGTDAEMIAVTFVQGNKIFKTVQDYSNGGPNEFVWANIPLRHLYQSIKLDLIPVNNLPFYLNLHFFKFIRGEKELELTQSESFLLWDTLRQGSKVSTEFKSRFNISFEPNYYWFPSGDEEFTGIGYDDEKRSKVKEISTDGRYYKFLIEGKEPETIDIGFNFFDTNFSLADFKEKGKYD